MEDKEIVQLILNPSTLVEGFNCIVEHYQERLYWHIRKMVLTHDDADDVLQNTFIKVWKALPNFRGDSKIYTWLYRIATNESLNHLQSTQKKRNQNASINDHEHLQLASDPYFNGDEAATQLWRAIESLPDKQKTVFKLKYFESMKYDDISEVLGTSVGGLKASYHHAVSKIKVFLSKELNH